MATPLAIGMLTQIAYQIIDLYFITKIGVAETAGVSAAGNIFLLVASLTQVLGVGVTALVAQAAGRRDRSDASLVFNQALGFSAVFGMAMMLLLYTSSMQYLKAVAPDKATVEAGLTFIYWIAPGYALTLPTVVMSSALRGAGINKPTVALYILTVLVNAALAPILIAGWGTGVPLGVMGAGLATTIATASGLLFFAIYCHRSHLWTAFDWRLLVPIPKQWLRVLAVGLPAGGDTALFFIYNAVVYYSIRDLGSAAQSGFGVGSRVLQTLLLPALCICLSAGPIAGQNFGAKNIDRVRQTFIITAVLGSAAMFATTILIQCQSTAFIGLFDADSSTAHVARCFLELSSWALVAQAVVTTCSGMFQGFGNTMPALISSCVRLVLFSGPAVWLSMQPAFVIDQVWYLSVATLMLQAAVSLWLLRAEFRRHLLPLATPTTGCMKARQAV